MLLMCPTWSRKSKLDDIFPEWSPLVSYHIHYCGDRNGTGLTPARVQDLEKLDMHSRASTRKKLCLEHNHQVSDVHMHQ